MTLFEATGANAFAIFGITVLVIIIAFKEVVKRFMKKK